MNRKRMATTVLSCAMMGLALVGCDEASKQDGDGGSPGKDELLTGTEKITVGEYEVNVSCAGEVVKGRPTVVLLHGGGDDVTKLAELQKTLSEDGRVCSYDRLGAGKSDKPKGEQDFAAVGETLTGVIDEVAGSEKVVLAGHSMGGLIAGRYAPENPDKVAGLVLLDATSPSAVADLERRIPADAGGAEGELRSKTLAVYGGQNPEKLVFADGEVASAGDVPVRVVRHGQPYFEQAAPGYGAGLEQDWVKGQKAWLGLSGDSELSVARKSGHYIYTDEPDVAVAAIEDVASQA